MIRSSRFGIAQVMFMALFSGITTAKTDRPRPVKAQVRFLATSSCIRGTWGSNQDVYLTEIVLHAGSEPVLARLMDEFLPFQLPLSVDSLTSTAGTILRIRRDEQCDMPYAKMQFRTAPGDPMAIIPIKLHYEPILPRTPAPDEVLPCYRIVRS